MTVKLLSAACVAAGAVVLHVLAFRVDIVDMALYIDGCALITAGIAIWMYKGNHD